MPRIDWPLQKGRPCVQVTLTLALSGTIVERTLLADTGAGSLFSGFEIILDEDDCLHCGGNPLQPIPLGGAYVGVFPVYLLSLQIPALGFSEDVRAVGVPTVLAGFDGIACFKFLNRFQFGNFGGPKLFGLGS